jgi:DNA-binding LacI/PurR family transcriptional regulator
MPNGNPSSAAAAAIEATVRRLRGRRLMPERELAQQHGISRPRVRAILADLQRRGLIARRQGSGTYALEDGSTVVSDVVLLVDAQLKLRDDPFFSAMVERLQQACQSEGIRCTLERIEPGERPVILEDGIIAVGLAARHVLERLGRKDVPAIGLFVRVKPAPGARVALLDLDDRAGGRVACEHLLRAGCRALVYLGHQQVPASASRLAGAAEVAREAGVTLQVVESGMNYAAGISDAAELVVSPTGARTGVIAANDWLALGLHTGLMTRGRRVRDRFEIVSFDGLPITADPSLHIRSLAAPIDEMAADAIAELRRLAATPNACGRDIVYPLR